MFCLGVGLWHTSCYHPGRRIQYHPAFEFILIYHEGNRTNITFSYKLSNYLSTNQNFLYFIQSFEIPYCTLNYHIHWVYFQIFHFNALRCQYINKNLICFNYIAFISCFNIRYFYTFFLTVSVSLFF